MKSDFMVRTRGKSDKWRLHHHPNTESFEKGGVWKVTPVDGWIVFLAKKPRKNKTRKNQDRQGKCSFK